MDGMARRSLDQTSYRHVRRRRCGSDCQQNRHDPLSSMRFPNDAPSRNRGKNRARKLTAPPMKVCVQCASRGSRRRRGNQGQQGCEQQYAPVAIGKPDQEAESEEGAKETRGLSTPPAADRDRWSSDARGRGRAPREKRLPSAVLPCAASTGRPTRHSSWMRRRDHPVYPS